LKYSGQINVFLNRLNAEPIGVSVFYVFLIDKNTLRAVRLRALEVY